MSCINRNKERRLQQGQLKHIFSTLCLSSKKNNNIWKKYSQGTLHRQQSIAYRAQAAPRRAARCFGEHISQEGWIQKLVAKHPGVLVGGGEWCCLFVPSPNPAPPCSPLIRGQLQWQAPQLGTCPDHKKDQSHCAEPTRRAPVCTSLQAPASRLWNDGTEALT